MASIGFRILLHPQQEVVQGSGGVTEKLQPPSIILNEKILKANKALLDCANRGDVPGMKEARKKGADINARGKDTRTAIMICAMKGHTDGVEFCIAENASLSMRDENTNLTAWGLARKFNRQFVVDILEKKGLMA